MRSRDDFSVSLNAGPNGEVRQRQNDLYQGYKTVSVPYNDKNVEQVFDTVPLFKNTNHIQAAITRRGNMTPGHTLQRPFNSVFLVIEADMDALTSRFYRIDFYSRDKYQAVYRNSQYIFNITRVYSNGYDNLQDAMLHPRSKTRSMRGDDPKVEIYREGF